MDDVRTRMLVASPDLDLSGDVPVWVQTRSGVCERNLRIDQWLEHLVLDADRMRRAPRLFGVVGCDQGDGLAPVPHHGLGEHRLVWDLKAIGVAPGHVLVGEHGPHARHGFRLAGVDRDDAGVRMRAAHGRAPEHPVHMEVGRVREFAPGLELGVRAAHRLAHAAAHDHRRRQLWPGRHFPAAILSAARWTASMILA